MRHPLTTFLAACLLLVSITACEAEPDEADVNDVGPPLTEDRNDAFAQEQEPVPVPEVEMTTLDGERLTFDDFRGEVVVVNFWATWCGPCRVEVPDLIEMQDAMRDQGVTILGIAVGEDEDQIRPFAQEFGINYPLVPDATREISESFDGIYGLPTTIVVNPDGEQVERILGLFSVTAMQERIERMLAERA